MNQIIQFNNNGFSVRSLLVEGEPWFVAKDVCKALGLSNVTETLKRVDLDDLSSVKLNSGGQLRNMKVINESGMYQIIFMSNKPQAKKFKKWVTSEVLPSIRKTGSYSLQKGSADINYALQELKTTLQLQIKQEFKEIDHMVTNILMKFSAKIDKIEEQTVRNEKENADNLIALNRTQFILNRVEKALSNFPLDSSQLSLIRRAVEARGKELALEYNVRLDTAVPTIFRKMNQYFNVTSYHEIKRENFEEIFDFIQTVEL